MARKRYATEQIIGMLREAEVRLSRGETIGLICRGFPSRAIIDGGARTAV